MGRHLFHNCFHFGRNFCQYILEGKYIRNLVLQNKNHRIQNIVYCNFILHAHHMTIITILLQFYSILQYHFSFILHIAILFLKFISYLPPLSIQVAPFLQAPLAQASNSYWHPIPVKALLHEQFMELP